MLVNTSEIREGIQNNHEFSYSNGQKEAGEITYYSAKKKKKKKKILMVVVVFLLFFTPVQKYMTELKDTLETVIIVHLVSLTFHTFFQNILHRTIKTFYSPDYTSRYLS